MRTEYRASAWEGFQAPAGRDVRPIPWAQSRRLALREFRIDDIEDLARMHRDTRVRALLLDDYPLDQRAVARAFIGAMSEFYRQHPGLGIWHAGLTGNADEVDRFAGWFSLLPMAGCADAIEIGGRLVPSVWGSGIALEGGALLLDHAFESLAADAVWGTCHPGNRSAQIVLTALGFSALGVGDYDHKKASLFRIELNDWHSCRDLPIGKRMRRAIAAARAN